MVPHNLVKEKAMETDELLKLMEDDDKITANTEEGKALRKEIKRRVKEATKHRVISGEEYERRAAEMN